MNTDPTGRKPTPLQITVFGPVAASVISLLEERYDRVTTVCLPDADTIVLVADIDQAGERALLTLLWDTGHSVRSVRRDGS
ncbi:hypothetical protein ASC77_25305 [Nocardioides sp. Root1257]|uniref:hypothetical protein n=1 Tax=unclassified Nocardioides TaxID=2615069 RepID=UPI0006FD70DC|nr:MULTISPECIES: hypothetical protein [unclassified Nocardioides]KQW50974.1 hypothetical protein ASC77_25305 [Nocardioides sp. Root1257]KRC53770.1 hypothetical protein ASE24_25095 [Nocardioides sp. Root224]